MTAAAYLICATPRSGSTLLCDLLKETGIAGRPNSFYRVQSIPDYVEHWGIEPGDGVAFERRYLAAAIENGTGGTGMFGMRLNGDTLQDDLLPRLGMLYPDISNQAERIAAAFGTPVYIHLRREDQVAQAVSRAIAEQTGLWHRHADGEERERVKPHTEPVFDVDTIMNFIVDVKHTEEMWRIWSSAHGIKPVEVTYEELSANPIGTLAGILEALGLDPAVAQNVTPRTAKLADARSEEWMRRFLREFAARPVDRA